MIARIEAIPKNLCLNCFADQGQADACPRCGYAGEISRPHHAMPPGSILQGRYLTGRILQRASNEFVLAYRAIDTRSNVPLVVREYFPRELARRLEGTAIAGPNSMRDAPSYSFGLKSFLSETRELRSLFDPHVVSTRHIFEENGTAYAVEDFYEAQTLAQYLDEPHRTLTETEALRLIAPLLDSLQSAHNKDLLHLNLCPENILIRDTGEPLIVGFATSRIALAERNLSLPGLPNSCFAPIERYLSTREMGPWTDIYSVAAILYRLLTGIDPPEATERSEADTLIPAADRLPSLSARISAALALGLQVNRKDRLQTIAEFRQILMPDSPAQDDMDLGSSSPPSAWARTGGRALGLLAKMGFALGGLAYVTILGYIAFISLTKPHSGPGDPRPSPPPSDQASGTLEKAQPTPAIEAAQPAAEPPEDPPTQSVASVESATTVITPSDFEALVSRADSGTPQDWFTLAKAYENGEGTVRSIKKAIKWYRLSAEQNLPEAQTALGRIYVAGKDGQRNRAIGVDWYRRAAGQGFPDAQFALATLYELGFGVPQDTAEALKWYRMAADGGQAMAQNRLGKIYDDGQGVVADDQLALMWYRRAAEQGDGDAQVNLALMYENGEGVAADRAEALRWLERAAAGGNSSAKALLKKLQTSK